MADAVSKLYAEIGFKVNQDGLKQVQSILKDFAKQMNDINKATKEAARQFGVFSKDQAKQEIHNARLATEASRKAVHDKRIQIMETRELDRQNDRAKREKEKEERKVQKELAKQEREQAKEADRAARERKKRLKDTLNSFRSFAVGLRNTFLSLAGVGAGATIAGMKQSLDRSVATRDFMLQTGVDLKQLQNIVGGFANIGSAMSQQQIMGDIVGVSQNLQEIALGKGDLAPYKLLGLAARRGDIMGVISEAGRAIQGLDNPMALNLLKKIGLSGDWLSYFRLQQREGGSRAFIDTEGQASIVEAKTSLRQLSVAFRNFSDNLTAKFSVDIQEASDGLVKILDKLSRHAEEIVAFIEGFFGGIHKVGEGAGNIVGIIKNALFSSPLEGVEHSDAQKAMKKMEEYSKTLAPQKWKKFMENSQTPITARPVYIDNRTMNSTINGVENEDMAEKIEQVMENAGYKSNREVKNIDVNMATNLNVMARTV